MFTFFSKLCKISLLLLENKFNQVFESLQPIKQLYRKENFHKNPATPSTGAIYTTPIAKFCIKAFHLVTIHFIYEIQLAINYSCSSSLFYC